MVIEMPKVMNQDIIDKIAEYASKGYSKAAIAKELSIDRATVRKYSPKEQGPEEEKGKQPPPRLSLEEEFNLVSKKAETDHELESLLNKIKGWKWETESLKARGKAAVVGIDFLKEKLDKAESVTDVDEVRELAAKVKDEVTTLLEEDEPLHKQRQEQEEKKEEWLMRVRLNELAWVFPCGRDQAEKIINRFLWKLSDDIDDPIMTSLEMVGEQLRIAEHLGWGDNTSNLRPLITECANLLKGNWGETERIIGILYSRKKQILIPSDEDMEKKYSYMIDLLAKGVYELFVEVVLKFTAALGRLAEERFIEKEELLSKETPEPVVG